MSRTATAETVRTGAGPGGSAPTPVARTFEALQGVVSAAAPERRTVAFERDAETLARQASAHLYDVRLIGHPTLTPERHTQVPLR